MWMIKTVLGRIRLRKGAVKRRTVGGIERHIKESLIKAWLGSVRLAHLNALYHWGLGEAVKILGVPA